MTDEFVDEAEVEKVELTWREEEAEDEMRLFLAGCSSSG